MALPGQNRPVCILSVGRSGTSLLARVLNILGVDFGPEDTMLAPNDWNPEGFWEQRAIMDLNDDVLAALGGTFFEPPLRPAGWERTPAMAPYRERAAAIVEECFAGSSRWGFKDPRTVFTLPLWRDVVGPMDFVIALRDPGEVIASFRAGRPEMDPVRFDELWLEANAAALSLTQDADLLIVAYDEWFDQPDAVTARLAAFLGVEDAVVAERMSRIEGAISHDLRRRRPDENERPAEVRALDFLLRQLRDGRPLSTEGAATLASSLRDGFMRQRRLADERDALEDRVRETEAVVQRTETRLIETRAEHERHLEDHEALAVRSGQLQAELDRLEAEHERQRQVLDDVLGSASWRLTAPLRGLKRLLVR